MTENREQKSPRMVLVPPEVADRYRVPPDKFLIVWRTAAGYTSSAHEAGDDREAANETAREMTHRRGIPHWIVQVVGVAREGDVVVEDLG